MSLPPIAEPVIHDPMVVFRVGMHVHGGLILRVIPDERLRHDVIQDPGAWAGEISVEAGFPPRHSKWLAMRKDLSHHSYFRFPPRPCHCPFSVHLSRTSPKFLRYANQVVFGSRNSRVFRPWSGESSGSPEPGSFTSSFPGTRTLSPST